MMKCLYIDCNLRRTDSRTKRLADSFFATLKGYEIKHLVLENENLKPLAGDFLFERQELLEKGDLTHPRFRYAYEFKDADMVVMSAPFWDLNIPALLKIYIENISVDGITFESTEEGLKGACRGKHLVYLTTRGGVYGENNPMETAVPYLKAFIPFFGFKEFHYIAAEGLDVKGLDHEKILNEAIEKTKQLAEELSI